MGSMVTNQNATADADTTADLPSEFEPTQRMSDVQKFGLFGE